MKRTLPVSILAIGCLLVVVFGMRAVYSAGSLAGVETALSATLEATLNPVHQKNLDEITQVATKIETETGFPAEVMIAQWAVESNWGEHPVCKANYFGIKRTSRNKLGCVAKTTEVLSSHQIMEFNRLHPDSPPLKGEPAASGSLRVEMTARFADYPTLEESCRDYVWMIQNTPPYAVAWVRYTQSKDAKRLLADLAGIYWTDPDYVKKAVAVLNQPEVQDALTAARAPSLPSEPAAPRTLPPVVVTGAVMVLGNIVLTVLAFLVKQQLRARQAEEKARHNAYLAKLEEVRREVSESQNKFFERINGTYVRDKLCGERCGALGEKVTALEERVEALE